MDDRDDISLRPTLTDLWLMVCALAAIGALAWLGGLP